MKWCRAAVLIVVVSSLGVGVVSGEDEDPFGEANVRARLVTDAARVTPGEPFFLGVVFDIKPGWHIYWKHPGDAGLATEIQWLVPAGIEVGELRWPLPISFDQSDGIAGYGYEGSVILAAEVVAPIENLESAVMRAEVSWLACKGVCVLGSASLEGRIDEIADSAAFEAWARALPRPIDAAQPPFSLRTTGGIGSQGLALWLQWREAPQRVEWFPAPPETLEVTNIRVQNRAGLTRVDAEARPMAGGALTAHLFKSLVVATSSDGERRGWELDVELEDQ